MDIVAQDVKAIQRGFRAIAIWQWQAAVTIVLSFGLIAFPFFVAIGERHSGWLSGLAVGLLASLPFRHVGILRDVLSVAQRAANSTPHGVMLQSGAGKRAVTPN